jgi:8-oxo-dGTP diphosphatase
MFCRRFLVVPVACGIIEQNGTFLAARRGPGQSNPGLWEFPGGKVRPRESAEEALSRELREELGIGVSATARLSSHVHEYPSIVIELIPFLCVLNQGQPQPNEHAEVRWLKPREALSLSWSPADIPVLKEYLGKL